VTTHEIDFARAVREIEKYDSLKSLCYDLDALPEQGDEERTKLVVAAFLCGRRSGMIRCQKIAKDIAVSEWDRIGLDTASYREGRASDEESVEQAIRERIARENEEGKP
jgi:hypothetical protein